MPQNKEYIERQAVIKHLDNLYDNMYAKEASFYQGFQLARHNVNVFPAADVVEVRHGRWRLNHDGSGTCSECGRTQIAVWDYDTWQNYCGHCGCKMDKEDA